MRLRTNAFPELVTPPPRPLARSLGGDAAPWMTPRFVLIFLVDEENTNLKIHRIDVHVFGTRDYTCTGVWCLAVFFISMKNVATLRSRQDARACQCACM